MAASATIEGNLLRPRRRVRFGLVWFGLVWFVLFC